MKRASFEIKNDAKKIISAVFRSVLLTTLIYLAIILIVNELAYSLCGFTEYAQKLYDLYLHGKDVSALEWPEVSSVSLLLSAAVMLMSSVLDAGFSGYVMRLSRGEKVGLGAIFDVFSHFGKALAIKFLTGILTMLGMLLFVVPGIVLAYRYRLAIFIMYDNPELGPIACMKKSAQLMNGNKMNRFVLDISFIGWILASNIIASLLAYPVLELWLTPYMGVAGAVFYNDILGIPSRVPGTENDGGDGSDENTDGEE